MNNLLTNIHVFLQGSCLGAFSSTFPVAFLEPHLNKHNQFSLLNRIADHSLEAQGKEIKD